MVEERKPLCSILLFMNSLNVENFCLSVLFPCGNVFLKNGNKFEKMFMSLDFNWLENK